MTKCNTFFNWYSLYSPTRDIQLQEKLEKYEKHIGKLI